MSTAEQEEKKKEQETEEEEEEFFSLSFFNNHKFEEATKRISVHSHIGKFLTSPTYRKLIKFLNDLADSVKEKKISSDCHISSTTKKFVSLLSSLNKWCDEIEPLTSQTRYGNKAYRLWQDKLRENSHKLIKNLLPESWIKCTDNKSESILNDIISELNGYLLGSFGDYTRIDYGTGHELTFICFILILVELRVFRKNDFSAIVLKIFNKYIILMRKIQIKYALEPAGTKGVWGLDDYQYLSFFFGAAQLINHPQIKPSDILNDKLRKENNNDSEYLYLSCISFILEMKTGLFAEHSPLLNDISGVPYWIKVKSGLLKMYQDDVLKKLPVIQHFLFASILSIDLPPINKDNKNDEKAQILKRKQALIAKLNAKNKNIKNTKNTNSNQATTPPQQQQQQNNDNNPMIMTAAPWAQTQSPPQQQQTNKSDIVHTKAPWAK